MKHNNNVNELEHQQRVVRHDEQHHHQQQQLPVCSSTQSNNESESSLSSSSSSYSIHHIIESVVCCIDDEVAASEKKNDNMVHQQEKGQLTTTTTKLGSDESVDYDLPGRMMSLSSSSSSLLLANVFHLPLTTILHVALPLPVVLFIIWIGIKRKTTRQRQQRKSSSSSTTQERRERKIDFLSRYESKYGYKQNPAGYIDSWRPVEFPNLINPISVKNNDDDSQKKMSNNNDKNEDIKEVYLDYAGSALPTKSQLSSMFTASDQILANPHSTGPAASRTKSKIDEIKHSILKHFGGLPGKLSATYNVMQQKQQSLQRSSSSSSEDDVLYHAGYELLFTSGTTEALRLIAEHFPWTGKNYNNINCNCDQHQSSIFLYAQNSHTSVVGIREIALQCGGKFVCRTIQEIESMTKQDFQNLIKSDDTNDSDSNRDDIDIDEGKNHCCQCQANHLLAIPFECNFGGHRTQNLQSIIQLARSAGFCTLIDTAKAASTTSIQLNQLDADFACCSFYKMFGSPTGLGALFIKRSTMSSLFRSTSEHKQENQQREHHHYTGGGSVDIVLPNINFCVPRTEPSLVSSWTSGTVHFRGIVQLQMGFDDVALRGGMNQIHQHTTCLSEEFIRRLQILNHGNGRPIAQIYRHRHQINIGNNDDRYGPTVAFNLLRDDGSVVGYNEVSKLAALHQPPIQFRTGCFCNPGACQEALGISDEEAKSNYEISGHVCGDHVDLINGKPTGAIRISFGKDSIWEDLDVFVMFVERTFINHRTSTPPQALVSKSPKDVVRLSEIYLFPIKSCAAQCVQRWKMELPSGKLLHDREFALVDSSGTAMRLQSYPKMALIQPVVDLSEGTMRISAPEFEDIVIDLTPCAYNSHAENIVKVCGNKCRGRLWGDYKVSEWFSNYLGVSCWLARYLNGEYITGQQEQTLHQQGVVGPKTSFANEQPILLISQNSVETLNEVLKDQSEKLVGTRQFRPNLVVQSFRFGGDELSHVEDEWVRAKIPSKNIVFDVKGTCARCAMVDFDPTTGSKHGKTIKAMARYRRRNGQITFGIFLQAWIQTGHNTKDVWLEVGDELNCEELS